MRTKQPDGSWSLPVSLGSIINTSFDEDYPYYDAKNKVLYFSSQGHNSLGGYDVYKSHYDEDSNSWSEPENLNFPINSPDDDFLFIPDSSGSTAYFSSTRSSPEGLVDVYKVSTVLHTPKIVLTRSASKDSDNILLSNYVNKVARMDVNVDTTKALLVTANATKITTIKNTPKPKTPIKDTARKVALEKPVTPLKTSAPLVVVSPTIKADTVKKADLSTATASVNPKLIVPDGNDEELEVKPNTNSGNTVKPVATNTTAVALAVKKDTVAMPTQPGVTAPDKKVTSVVSMKVDSANNLGMSEVHWKSFVVPTNGVIRSVVGNGKPGFKGDGGPAIIASFDTANGIAIDDSLNLYISDSKNNRIRKVYAATGKIATIAGTGVRGSSEDGVKAIDANIFYPTGIKVDAGHNVYFCDAGNVMVKKIAFATNKLTTVAGTGFPGYGGDGDIARNARLLYPVGLDIDDSGNVFIADAADNVVRKVSKATGLISTFAGTGRKGFSGNDGPANKAQLNNPFSVAVDRFGNVYISDGNNHIIRKVNKYGIISDFAGTGKAGYNGDSVDRRKIELDNPAGICTDHAGNVYVMDPGNARAMCINVSTNMMYTIAGSKIPGYNGDGGRAIKAEVHYPFDVAVDNEGNSYILDVLNFRVRKVKNQVKAK